MAFADELVVLASTPRGLLERLDGLVAFLASRGLSINVAKGFALSLQPSGREKNIKILTKTSTPVASHYWRPAWPQPGAISD